MMEADSTTVDSNRNLKSGTSFPFNIQPGNLKIYLDIISDRGEGSRDIQIVQWLQNFGLLPRNMRCRKGDPSCHMVCKAARVVDKVQWACESCGQRLPIRHGSFFMRVQCSLLQVLQVILAWCEDAEWEVAASFFDVKPKVVTQIYDRLDQLGIDKHSETQLGGEDSVVLVEMYPDCLNRLSPDTTDQPHLHQILMMADTKHIPTRYWLRVIKQDSRKTSHMGESLKNKILTQEVKEAVSKVVAPGSMLVLGSCVPPEAVPAVTLPTLLQHADADMQHFLCNRIWRGAVTLCAASRDACAGTVPSTACAHVAQRYLDTALYRRKYGDGFFAVVLTDVANGSRLQRVGDLHTLALLEHSQAD